MKPVLQHGLQHALWAVTAAFGAYFCMYAFRKPFTAASFEFVELNGYVGLKSILVAAQVSGYMLSKFIGIKVVSEISPARRGTGILLLIGCAEAALIGFGLAPSWAAAGFLFVNGLSLGMVFGLVLGFLEGRQVTEALTAGLCASFILADGIMKSLGTWLLAHGVSEFWMPSVAGAIFLPPLVLFVYMLSRISPPSAADVAARTQRVQMFHIDRRELFVRYGIGLTLVVVMYLAVTVIRSFRADFAPEIWSVLGASAQAATYTASELWVVLGVLLVTAATMFIRDNRRAFSVSLLLCAGGLLLVIAALLARTNGFPLSPFVFMVLLGLGLYVPYVAVHTTVFERLLAMTGDRGNIGFLMYVADSIGYLGYVAVMLIPRESAKNPANFLTFFLTMCWTTVGVALGAVALAWLYFRLRVTQSVPATLASNSGTASSPATP